MEYYSAIRKNELHLPGMDLESITLNEMSQMEKVRTHMIFTYVPYVGHKTQSNKQTRQTKTHRHRQ